MADEARAMLDALMGSDRDEELPSGMAVNKGQEGNWSRTKKSRSCFDRDICPLHCVWGVDVYELFVNTKSDTMVGSNQCIVDGEAHKEFQSLSKQEKDRMGYHAMLFRKLQDLVNKCDRTVQRNKEKLRQEMARQTQKRGGQDLVKDVDEGALQQLASAMVRLEYLHKDLRGLIEDLDKKKEEERDLRQKVETAQVEEKIEEKMDAGLEVEGKPEESSSNGTEKPKEEDDVPTNNDTATVEEVAPDQENSVATQADSQEQETQEESIRSKELVKLEQELLAVRLHKQFLLLEIRQKMMQEPLLKDSIESQTRQLQLVKSDITSDKTVCEVSGNFMSSRDADERIAAHYAGKQYVGWKLVRGKYKEMQAKYGRSGPPAGERGPSQRGDYGGGYGGGGRDRNYDRDRSRDQYGRGGGDRYRRDPSPPRWQRDRGPGHDRGRRGGGGGGGGYRHHGGGW